MRLSNVLTLALRPVLGLYLLSCCFFMCVSALALPVVPFEHFLGSSTIGIEVILLLFGLGMTWLARLETTKIWLVVLSLGVVSTVLSGLHVVGNDPPLAGCAILLSNHGFPFSWYRAANFYMSPSTFCPAPAISRTMADPTAFLLDMIFYVGVYLATLEVFRGVSSLYVKLFSRSSPGPMSLAPGA